MVMGPTKMSRDSLLAKSRFMQCLLIELSPFRNFESIDPGYRIGEEMLKSNIILHVVFPMANCHISSDIGRLLPIQ